jgi:chromosome segregation ATPase
MSGQLSISIIEIIILMSGAVILGITIHFFIISRKSLKDKMDASAGGKLQLELRDWKSRFFNETENRDKQIEILQKKLADTEENINIYSIEAEEVRKENKILKQELNTLRQTTVQQQPGKTGYIDQLKQAQSSLLEHNQRINQLLEQIDLVKETEEQQQEMLRNNEEMMEEIEELQKKLSLKEKEILNIHQKEHLTTEMNSMLDSAYSEFGILQEKIQKLEVQVNVSKKINIEYEDLKESYYKISKDFEEQKLKYNHTLTENRQLQTDLDETEDKLKEANFQRQQLQKKVAYLEELNNDLQAVTDANKKLEGQLRRIGELESMLSIMAEEKNELARKQSEA